MVRRRALREVPREPWVIMTRKPTNRRETRAARAAARAAANARGARAAAVAGVDASDASDPRDELRASLSYAELLVGVEVLPAEPTKLPPNPSYADLLGDD